MYNSCTEHPKKELTTFTTVIVFLLGNITTIVLILQISLLTNLICLSNVDLIEDN